MGRQSGKPFQWCRKIEVADRGNFPEQIFPLLQQIISYNWAGWAIVNEIGTHGLASRVLIEIIDEDECQAKVPFPTWGTDNTVTIFFNPSTWLPGQGSGSVTGAACARGPGSKPDEVLLHELVHAHRFARRKWKGNAMEEWFAILVTNIYMSEKKRPFLRSFNHDLFAPLEDTLASSAGFLQNADHASKLKQVFAQEGLLFWNVRSAAMARFNPIHLFMQGAP